MLTKCPRPSIQVERWTGEEAVTIGSEGRCSMREGAHCASRLDNTVRIVIASSRALAVWGVPYDSTAKGQAVTLAGELFRFVPQENEARRVVISTNVAGASLTIHGIVHVIDSGLINQNKWRPDSETMAIPSHTSEPGRLQAAMGTRRVLRSGDAWTLAAEKRSGWTVIASMLPVMRETRRACFPYYSQPEILRSPLEQVVLTAKMAGVKSLDVANFPWLKAPHARELAQAE